MSFGRLPAVVTLAVCSILAAGSTVAAVSDDFNACLIDTGTWSAVDPIGDAQFSVSGAGSDNAHLVITVPGGLSHDPWTNNDAARLMQFRVE